MYILTHASFRIFDIFSTKEKRDHLVASKNRWLECQGQRVAQQETSQSDLEDMNIEGVELLRAPKEG